MNKESMIKRNEHTNFDHYNSSGLYNNVALMQLESEANPAKTQTFNTNARSYLLIKLLL